MPRHPSPAQREASRRNGRQSRGPHDTSQTRFNAVKHGLLSKKACFLSEEDRRTYRELHQGLVDDLRPKGMLEAMLVERLASAHCRQMRAIELRAWWERPRAQREAAMDSGELVADPRVFTGGGDNYARGGELLLRYERELQRQFDTALRELSVISCQLSATAGKRQSLVGSRQSVVTAGEAEGTRRPSAVELGIVRREGGAGRAADRTPSPQPSPSGRGTEPQPTQAAPRSKLQRIREARQQRKRRQKHFVVHDEPGGPVVVEEYRRKPQTDEEVEAFFDGLEERLERGRELERRAKEAREAAAAGA